MADLRSSRAADTSPRLALPHQRQQATLGECVSGTRRCERGRGACTTSAGRAASASERVSGPPRGCGSSSLKRRSDGERHGAGDGPLPGFRWSSSERSERVSRPPRGCRSPSLNRRSDGESDGAGDGPLPGQVGSSRPSGGRAASATSPVVEQRDRTGRHPRHGGRMRHRLTELELRVAHRARPPRPRANRGATDTGSWWANQTWQTTRDAKRRPGSRTPCLRPRAGPGRDGRLHRL